MFLHNNAIESLDLIWHCTNLVKLDLAHNNISTLPSGAQLGCLRQLSLLYLHNNNIQTWDAIGALAALPSLTLLTMHDNPVAAHPKFRHYVVNKIPHLQALDAHLVSDEERISRGEDDRLAPFPPLFA